MQQQPSTLPRPTLPARHHTGGIDPDAEEKRRREEEEAARAAARAHGTPVTVEAFMAWKAAYDAGEGVCGGAVLRCGARRWGVSFVGWWG